MLYRSIPSGRFVSFVYEKLYNQTYSKAAVQNNFRFCTAYFIDILHECGKMTEKEDVD